MKHCIALIACKAAHLKAVTWLLLPPLEASSRPSLLSEKRLAMSQILLWSHQWSTVFFNLVSDEVTVICATSNATKKINDIKVPLRPNFSFSIFLHFRVEDDCLTHFTKFQSFTTIGSIFFQAFYSWFHGCHYLALFRKLTRTLGCKLQEVTSLAQHEKFHMANFHMNSTS